MRQDYDRRFYERQGRDALTGGAGIACSEPTITETVLRMAREHLSDSALVLGRRVRREPRLRPSLGQKGDARDRLRFLV